MNGETGQQATSTQHEHTDSSSARRHSDQLRLAAQFCEAVYNVRDIWPRSNFALPLKLLDRHSASGRTRLTLTYAQSSDGKIAGANGRMLALSNADSMMMTHTLRILHDGILVGIGTLLNDNPQLNARLLSPLPDGSSVPLSLLPRPIVLDKYLQTPLDCKLLDNAQRGRGKPPLIVAALGADENKSRALKGAGADVVEIPLDHDGHLAWPRILAVLHDTFHLHSVMVEGGATVIDKLLSVQPDASIIDELIVTVAPKSVGDQGLGYSQPSWLFAAILPMASLDGKACPTAALLPAPLTPIAGQFPCSFGTDSVFAWSSSVRN